VTKQVLIIYAAANGFLDDLPVELLSQFEKDLYQHFDLNYSELLVQLGEKAGLNDELKEGLKKGVGEIAEQFKATHGVAG
jgi:F-type H+-transporting ATPase subunit alpha